MRSERVRCGVVLTVAALVMGVAAPALAARSTVAATAALANPPASARDWHATIRDFAFRHFKNPAWGYSHCMRDYALALELASAASSGGRSVQGARCRCQLRFRGSRADPAREPR